MITDPRYMRASEWASQNTYALSQFGVVPILRADDEWREWVQALLQNPGLAQQSLPRPSDYNNFLDWATRFVQVIKVQ
jgi:hypothetical protein